ncbi:hypothetical protein LTR51_005080 [Lithohypha guttulata]|uniref:Nephrocystin 3-like N-terminal domain-containing protein n=1 Tax=Lithohypha guttulata TaxID=1690604 RepID=A0AAN7T426_9EURO|nr:hypothetical protein LTR51_005080 [Lithohypha guttulata]KAK5087829.1 hypothetical protein LTR05_002044 [Lithohypha guttulata]
MGATAHLETSLNELGLPTKQLDYIYGCMKFALEIASAYPSAFDNLLDVYKKLGNNAPTLQQYESSIKNQPFMHKCMRLMQEELVAFHFCICQCFRPEPRLKALFDGVAVVLHPASMPDCAAPIFLNIGTYVAGNNYERKNVNDNAHALFGNHYSTDTRDQNACSDRNLDSKLVLQQLEDLKQNSANAIDVLEKQKVVRRQEQYSALVNWLAGTGSTDYQQSAHGVHEMYCDTGKWILKHEKVTTWLEGEGIRRPVLWMYGIPGAGKTILTSIIVDACQMLKGAETAYHYCRHDDSQTCTPIGVLSGLLHRIVRDSTSLLPYFDEQRQKSREAVLTKEKSATTLLKTFCYTPGRKYLIVDGLDECALSQRKTILSSLSSLVKEIDDREAGKVRLLIVSQHVGDIGRALVDAEELRLTVEHNRDDIRYFVAHWSEKI